MPQDRTTLLGQLQANHAPGPHWEAGTEGNPAPDNPKVRLIAFYLPQFHPIPENDAWWGQGFTEWTNTTKALPRFAGHVQPRLPADLGFYDLRDPSILHRQARLARRYGISGFCFHHYWFNGRRLLETPLNLFLADPSIDIPFCINWANENWTRRWDGLEQDILLAQNYSPEDDIAFARHLVPIAKDPRYIRVAGRPLVMIYRPALLPDPLASMRRWRTEFARAGLPNPMIVMAQAFRDNDPRIYGLDAAAQFPPHQPVSISPINDRLEILDPNFTGDVVDYADVAEFFATAPQPPWRLFRSVSPSWDNEPRKPGCGYTLAHSTPALYGHWLDRACRIAIDEAAHEDEPIVFINAWNEWAEGAHLEPDRHFGHAYLAETARILAALDRAPAATPIPAIPPAFRNGGRLRLALVSHDAHFHGAQTVALALAKSLVLDHKVDLSILIGGAGEMTLQFELVSRCETVPGEFNDQAAWHDVARRLVGRGVSAILCNTAVSARAIRPLHEAGLRIVQLIHELPSLVRAYNLEDACRDAATHAAAIVFPSAWVRDRFIEVAGPIRGRAVIRHQGLNLRRMTSDERHTKRERTRREYSIADDQRVVLGIGFGDVRKGLDLWSSLVRLVVATVPGARFVWIGRIEPTVRHWVTHDLRALGLEDRLLLLDQMPDLSPWYAAADLFVLTSREDPFPSVVIEAMACGLPTVVFEESGGVVDLVHDAGGITVPYLDVPAMADAIAGLLTDDARAAEMGRILARRIAADFDYADYAKALIELAAPPTPSLSVVVPNFNYARHLRQRLESIWAQMVCPTEILILDDASSDGSPDLIAALAAESPVPVRVVLNDTNSGAVSRQWARGVGLARGDLVWIAEADDFADPGFLAAVLPAFEDPDVVLSYSDSRMVGEDGRILAPDYRAWTADIDPVRWTADFRASGAEAVAEAFAVKNTLPNVSAAVFRRAALQAVLDEHVDAMAACRNAADWMCYIRLLANGGTVAFTGWVLNSHRRHESSVTLAANDYRHLEEIQAMQDLAAAVAPVPAPIRAMALRYRHTVARQFGLPLGRSTAMQLDDDAWRDLLRSVASGGRGTVNGRPMPPMPPAQMQVNTVGQAGAGAMDEAWAFAAQCIARFRDAPRWSDPDRILLDFGTGWGRIARCFLRDFRAENIFGVDVEPDFITTCRDSFPGPRFLNCSPMPPLALKDRSVDFIVGYSVYSHLSEVACQEWTAEFARILRPGGMAALTTRGRWFFDYAAGMTGTDSYARSLAAMFPSFADAKVRYDRGELVHSNAHGVTGGGSLNCDFYGETFIPERYARDVLSKAMPLVEFHQGDSHPILFFQKPEA